MADVRPAPLLLQREELLGTDRAQRIHETALRILCQVGLAVLREDVRNRMADAGFPVRGERVHIEPRAVEEYLQDRRCHLAQSTPAADCNDGHLRMTMNPYPHHVHDLDADDIVPYTTDKLIEMTKFVDTFAEEGIYSAAPGYPLDVPPKLQPVIQYRVGAEYSRNGTAPVDPMTVFAARYVFEMAEALGQPIRTLPVYVFSPLRLGGESLSLVLHYLDRLDHIHVSSMPSVGATAPIDPFGALALATAEVLGGALTLTVVTGKPADFGIGIHAFDLRTGSMIFGSPEAFLFGLAASDLNAFYAGQQGRRHVHGGILTRANWPSAQAAAEKASSMTAGALIGARWFSGVGSLSLDEVFSPEQFLIDCDIRDHVQRLINGLQFGDQSYNWVQQVEMGVDGSFMTLDSTLDHYRDVYWYPQLFERGPLAAQQQKGRLRLHNDAKALLRERLARYDYELDSHKRTEIYRIWNHAVEDYGQGTTEP